MLIQIHISNFITLEKASLDFSTGTTVITGETGTGKSIVIDAIEFALGSRLSGNILRPGQEKADVALCFDTRKLPEAKAWLKSYDLDQENGECIIRRALTKDGRSRSYINNMPTTLQPLRELSDLLVNTHSQHEHHSLLQSDKQRDMTDHYAGHQHLVDKVHAFADELGALNDEITELRKLAEERNYRGEFLKFQLHELEELSLVPDEFQSLDLEHKQLAHAGELLTNIHHALDLVADNEEHNALHALNQALQALESVSRVDPKISTWIENIRSVIIQISDTEDQLRRYPDTINLNPERLQWLEERISTLFNLARKHKISPNELYDFQKKCSKELAELENSDERLSVLSQKLQLAEKNYHDAAIKLSESRIKSAKKLSAEITTLIHKLALPHAEFYVHCDQENIPAFSPNGLEKIIFQIKTNPGQPMQPLAKIASGGELSRVSLAIHMATAGKHTIPTLIFDEVDVGISGGTAEIVGKLLRRSGETHQVICITHLPQVAAQGHHHLRVEKFVEKQETHTKIKYLNPTEKINEIARMLGGIEITQKTLAHAREMAEGV